MSNRITKATAISVARKVADAYYCKTIDKVEDEKVEYATRVALDVIPKPVMGCVSEYAQWIASCRRAYFMTENGGDCLYSALNVSIPQQKSYATPALVIDTSSYKKLDGYIKVVNNLKDSHDRMVNEISSTILKLGTRKRVLEELPEIAEYLPADEEKHLPSTTFGDIRSILKSIKNGKNCNY